MESKKVKKIIKGEVYGNLTIISDNYQIIEGISCNGNKTRRAYWRCKCSCGEIILRSTTDIKTNKKKNMCKTCSYKSRPQSKLRYTDTERMYNLMIVARCKKSEGRILNNLSLKEYEEISSKDCYYCGEKPVSKSYLYKVKGLNVENKKFNGIDRLNSSLNYSYDNCVSCCSNCNIMKGKLKEDVFIEQIIKISKNLKQKENDN